MAPVTRRSKAATREAVAPARKQSHTREESWTLLDTNRSSKNSNGPDSFSFRSSIVPPDNDALRPLRTMADRVGKEVEKFSETMDTWYHQVYQIPDDMTEAEQAINQHQSTLRMVSKLKEQTITNTNIFKRNLAKEDLKQQAAEFRAKLQGTGLGRAVQRITESDRIKELRAWQAEEATWELATLIISQRYPGPGLNQQRMRSEAQAELEKIHRYTSDEDVWEHFLLQEQGTKEKHLILKWLQRTADRRNINVDEVSKQLEKEDQSHAGQTASSLGWMTTREKIKADKRMNSWNRPIEPGDVPLIGGDRQGRVVTQLDPDAPLRQGRSLENGDNYQENYLWLVSYEFLRRGKSWKAIREWYEDRNQSWRSVSLGMGGGDDTVGSYLGGSDQEILWRRLCSIAANAAKDPYERAVYGLLGGEIQSVLPMCRSWEDYLFAHYSCDQVAKFDAYLQKTLGKTTTSNTSRSAIKTLNKKADSVPVAAQDTMQIIQESIIQDTFEDLVYNVGIAIATAAHSDGVDSKLIPKTEEKTESKYMPFTEDPQALRLLLHLLCAFGRLGLKPKTPERHAIIENVIIGYVDFLRIAGKLDLLPLYASFLKEATAERILGRICLDILDPMDQRHFVKLMDQKLVEVDKVLKEQYIYALSDSGLDTQPSITKYQLLEDASDLDEEIVHLWPGQRIKDGLLQGDLGDKEAAIVESLGWYLHLNKGWHITFRTFSDALATLLVHGKVEAAVAVCERFSTREISLAKSSQYLAELGIDDEVDVTDWTPEHEFEQLAARRSTRASSKQPKNERRSLYMTEELQVKIDIIKVLKQQSLRYHQLEQLVIALHALREWRDAEDFAIETKSMASLRRDSTATNAKASTKDSFERLKQAMEPLLAGNFLVPSPEEYENNDSDDINRAMRNVVIKQVEGARLNAIRHAYLPEIILAYLSALQSSAFLLTRENFVYAMDLAARVASDDNKELSKCCVDTGRMPELVEAFAKVSQMMLKVGAGEGKNKSRHEKKRGWEGETLKIWDVGYRN